jgi:hypothetical protein
MNAVLRVREDISDLRYSWVAGWVEAQRISCPLQYPVPSDRGLLVFPSLW